MYHCKKCDYKTERKYDYKCHLQTKKHKQVECTKYFSCEACDYKTKDRSNYAKHCKTEKHHKRVMKERRHQYEEEKDRTVCEVCKKNFSNNKSYKTHRPRHDNAILFYNDLGRLKGVIADCLRHLPGGWKAPTTPPKEKKRYRKRMKVKERQRQRLKSYYESKDKEKVEKVAQKKAEVKRKKLTTEQLWKLRFKGITIKSKLAKMEKQIDETGKTDWDRYERYQLKLQELRRICNNTD